MAESTKRKVPLAVKILILIVALVLIVAGALVGVVSCVSATLNQYKTADYYEIGGDKIPSVKTVLGREIDVVGFGIEVNTNKTVQEISFATSGDVNQEMSDYVKYLTGSEGFLLLTDVNFNQPSATGFVFGKESQESGFVVTLTISYQPGSYTIRLERYPDTLTRF